VKRGCADRHAPSRGRGAVSLSRYREGRDAEESKSPLTWANTASNISVVSTPVFVFKREE
jgi:hypothetical protein